MYISVQDKIRTLKSEQDELRGGPAQRRIQVKVNIRFTLWYCTPIGTTTFCSGGPVPRGAKKVGGAGQGLRRRNHVIHRGWLNRYPGLDLFSDTTENKYVRAWITEPCIACLIHFWPSYILRGRKTWCMMWHCQWLRLEYERQHTNNTPKVKTFHMTKPWSIEKVLPCFPGALANAKRPKPNASHVPSQL